MGSEARALQVLTYWVPGIGLAALLVANFVFGTYQVEVDLKAGIDAIGGRFAGTLIMIVVICYYFFILNTFDPFWPVRKRLWKTGRIYLANDDSQNRAEPFLWSRQPLPPTLDVSSDS